MSKQLQHEQALIRAFVIPKRQERYLELLSKPRRRYDATREFAHFKHLDMRFAVPIPPSQQNPSGISLMLKSKGAGNVCQVISEYGEIDGKEMPLDEALEEIVGRSMGTFLSCIEGRLAYFEDEDERWILERTEKP